MGFLNSRTYHGRTDCNSENVRTNRTLASTYAGYVCTVQTPCLEFQNQRYCSLKNFGTGVHIIPSESTGIAKLCFILP